MISIFGENTKTQYVSRTSTGLTYTDAEYDLGMGNKNPRRDGCVPGKYVSALLVNTALKQYCAMSYVVVETIKNILKNYCGWSSSNIDEYFTEINESKIYMILGNTDNGFIAYFNEINKIIDGETVVGKAIYCTDSGTIQTKLNDIHYSWELAYANILAKNPPSGYTMRALRDDTGSKIENRFRTLSDFCAQMSFI